MFMEPFVPYVDISFLAGVLIRAYPRVGLPLFLISPFFDVLLNHWCLWFVPFMTQEPLLSPYPYFPLLSLWRQAVSLLSPSFPSEKSFYSWLNLALLYEKRSPFFKSSVRHHYFSGLENLKYMYCPSSKQFLFSTWLFRLFFFLAMCRPVYSAYPIRFNFELPDTVLSSAWWKLEIVNIGVAVPQRKYVAQ